MAETTYQADKISDDAMRDLARKVEIATGGDVYHAYTTSPVVGGTSYYCFSYGTAVPKFGGAEYGGRENYHRTMRWLGCVLTWAESQ